MKTKAKYISISNILHLLSAPASIPRVEVVLASLVVESLSNCKFSIVSNFCLIIDSCFHPSRALTRSLESFTPSTWTYFCYVKDILRAYNISDWQSEPHHQNQNPAEWRYRTIKAWTNTIMNRTGAPAYCWFLTLQYVCYILNHISTTSLGGQVPLQVLYVLKNLSSRLG